MGSNLIKNCDAALVVNGVDVFRLRERTSDGRLVVDFDIRASNGERIAKVAKNNVVFVADGFESINQATRSFVREVSTSKIVAMAEELTDGSVRITGDFWIDGHHVTITEQVLVTGGVQITGNTIVGFGKAIELRPDSIGIGLS